MTMTQDELGLCVVEVRDQIREAAPDAYAGYVTDAACYRVAKAAGIKATDALRAYRRFRPSTGTIRYPFPGSERRPSKETVAAVDVSCVPRRGEVAA